MDLSQDGIAAAVEEDLCTDRRFMQIWLPSSLFMWPRVSSTDLFVKLQFYVHAFLTKYQHGNYPHHNCNFQHVRDVLI
jgi:hypothetical protein